MHLTTIQIVSGVGEVVNQSYAFFKQYLKVVNERYLFVVTLLLFLVRKYLSRCSISMLKISARKGISVNVRGVALTNFPCPEPPVFRLQVLAT